MTEQSANIPPIPGETRRRAIAVFGSGNFYLRLGDELPAILEQCDRRYLLAEEVNGFVPVHALVTVFQFLEDLSDTQARDALRTRIDWQYALHLQSAFYNLGDDELCVYRQRLNRDAAMAKAFHELASRLLKLYPFAGQHVRELDTSQMICRVCLKSRLHWTLEAISDLVAVLALHHAKWLGSVAKPHWYTSYRSNRRLTPNLVDSSDHDITALGKRLGADLQYLLDAAAQLGPDVESGLREVRVLKRLWREQFESDGQGASVMRQQCSFCGAVRIGPPEEGA